MTTVEDVKKYVENAMRDSDPDYKPIYALMLFEHPDKEFVYKETGKHSGFPDLGCSFEAGFYYDLDDAVSAMHENVCDIRETVYSAGFVLVRFPGVYHPSGSYGRIYFVWDENRKGFYEAEEPEIFSHVAY